MENIQHVNLDPNLENPIIEILNRSMEEWLEKEDLIALYQRHAVQQFPISEETPGPAPFVEGLFIYDEDFYVDDYPWRDVNQVRRRNCVSRKLGNSTYPRIGYTEAILTLTPVTEFQRRTHHAKIDANQNHPGLAMVHYRVVDVPPQVVNQNEVANDQNDDEENHGGHVADDLNANEEVGNQAEGESDLEEEDDLVGDPDYNPLDDQDAADSSSTEPLLKDWTSTGAISSDTYDVFPAEATSVGNLQQVHEMATAIEDAQVKRVPSLKLLEEGWRKELMAVASSSRVSSTPGKELVVTKPYNSRVVMETVVELGIQDNYLIKLLEEKGCDLLKSLGKPNEVTHVDFERGYAFVYAEDERDAEDAIRGKEGKASIEWAKGELGKPRDGKGASNRRPTKTLFVINFDTKERRHFDSYGKVLNVRISRNFAFVQSANEEDAHKTAGLLFVEQ
ncbi:unnamed protein product [Microthlaspi erraticum]|uniref:RRM domain-containing protein n=1 Tax=Microthlaspi erraticum TaxID=1685480 RepID=A0A6D2LE76_9BRAS|nr:unnamed protein product [Microthlaspi erraticum]CAA7029033.1 unnamed protein product [Microthlaspi erraticum]CAA7059487.1 unnamed protein product [Microthlaspi erraticum]